MTDLYYHYGITRCKEICIKQVSALFKEDGVCAPIRQFYYEDNVTIQVEQSGSVRTTTIIADNPMRVIYLWGFFHYLDQFFMLCEGQFIEINEITFVSENANQALEHFGKICVDERPNFYLSADFCKYKMNCWLNPVAVLNQELFDNWIDLLDRLDIVHNVILYNVSSVGITIDIKAAFLIEAFEGLAELLKDTGITFRNAKPRESQLKINLIKIINVFGKDIFRKETVFDINKVTKVFVDSRNRIAHIKTKQDRIYLNGNESLIYTIKMFYLYRVVLLHLLGIESSCYNQKIKNSIDEWDNHKGIVDRFLDRLN